MTELALVVAMARNGVIGRSGALPWRLPEDMKHFRSLTLGKPILMGRRTFESIGRSLPERRNLVLTRHADSSWHGVEAVDSLDAALDLVKGAPELMVIGGAEVYLLALPRAHRIHLTRVLADVEGDTRLDWRLGEQWREVECVHRPADTRNRYDMDFVTLERQG